MVLRSAPKSILANISIKRICARYICASRRYAGARVNVVYVVLKTTLIFWRGGNIIIGRSA